MKRIKPARQLNATIRVPGSKSYTQRALVASALAAGRSVLKGALISEDTGYLMNALRALGADIDEGGADLTVIGTGGNLATPASAIYMGNNGTGFRFLTSMVCLGQGTYLLDGAQRMRQRPIQPLIDALNLMGVNARCVEENGCPPVQIEARGLAGGRTRLDSGLSSQYVSSLLLASPYAKKDTEIEIDSPLPSWPYVKLTMDVMARFGVDVATTERRFFHIRAPQAYCPADYAIEGDLSSATYFMAAAAIVGETVTISNANPGSIQGDRRFLDILEAMGCRVSASGDGVRITGPLSNHDDLAFDLNDTPDMVPALAVVCAFRRGETALRNISHLRVKESDRVTALCKELRKIGAHVEEEPDGLIIRGIADRGAEIECYDDHRIAMSFAIAGLAIDGVIIKDQYCVKKSFPDFWEKLESLS